MHLFILPLALTQPTIFDSIVHNAHAKVGVEACVIETNERVVDHESARFDTESTYKLPICMAALSKVSLRAKVQVTERDMFPGQYSPLRDQYPKGRTFTVEELVRYTIVLSDNTAADVLLRMAGGPLAVSEYLRGIGIGNFHVGASERDEFLRSRKGAHPRRNWATPFAAVEVLRALWHRRDANAKFLVEMMHECKTSPGRIKGMLPPGTWVAHKTGTGSDVANDIGIIALPNGKHLAIAVFLNKGTGDQKERDKVIAEIARKAYDLFAR